MSISDHRLASMAANTMDAIKKKMVSMKGEKDGALDKATTLEQKVAEQKAINEKVIRSGIKQRKQENGGSVSRLCCCFPPEYHPYGRILVA